MKKKNNLKKGSQGDPIAGNLVIFFYNIFLFFNLKLRVNLKFYNNNKKKSIIVILSLFTFKNYGGLQRFCEESKKKQNRTYTKVFVSQPLDQSNCCDDNCLSLKWLKI
jgi:hypothetical protein